MYKLTLGTSITRLSDGASIPPDPANTDYATYLDWLSQGNKPLPADPPTPAELVAIAQRQADAIEAANAKADATTQYLVSHTLVEINNYIRGQINTPAVTNLATATTSLKEMETLLIKLAAVVSILAKDKLR